LLKAFFDACDKIAVIFKEDKAEKNPVSTTKRKKRKRGEPEEISSKKVLWKQANYANVIKKKKSIDPRFEESSTGNNANIHRQAYKFLEDQIQEEIDGCKKLLKKAKSKTFIQEIHQKISQLNMQQNKIRRNDSKQAFNSKLKKAEFEKVGKGKNPYYFKKKDIKKLKHTCYRGLSSPSNS